MLCKFWVVTRHLFFFMWNEISIGSERSCCLPRQRPSLHSIFLSVFRLWAKIWYRNKTACSKLNWILCKAAGLYQWAVWEKGFCSDSNQTAQPLQMAARKSLETMSGVILNWLQPKFGAKSVANEMLCLKLESHAVTSVDRTSFFEQFSFLNIHLLYCWPTIHISISKICPKFQVISSHF